MAIIVEVIIDLQAATKRLDAELANISKWRTQLDANMQRIDQDNIGNGREMARLTQSMNSRIENATKSILVQVKSSINDLQTKIARLVSLRARHRSIFTGISMSPISRTISADKSPICRMWRTSSARNWRNCPRNLTRR